MEISELSIKKAVDEEPERSRWTDRLTETQKEHIFLECKDAKSKKEVEKIIEEKVPYGEMSSFLDEVKQEIL